MQLWVSNERDNHVIFGTSEHENITPLTLNRQPTAHGPLAYESIWRGTGWQAALEGSAPDVARLAGALAAAALAIAMTGLSHPFVSRSLRKATRGVRFAFVSLASRIRAALRRVRERTGSLASPVEASVTQRAFYVFPWLIPLFAILNHLANNLLIFQVSESIALSAIALVIVTVVFVILRLAFDNAAVAAVVTGLLGISFFSYGHVYIALGDHADDRYLLGIGVPTVLGLGALLTRRHNVARKIGFMLNVGSVALVISPLYQIALNVPAGNSQSAVELHERFPGLDQRLAETDERRSSDQLKDIYYIILDEYPRSGSPPDFDNSEFVRDLEERGFYVASQAHSNYRMTHLSIPSSINMYYVDDEHFNPGKATHQRLLAQVDDHMLGRILKAIGYRYVHISSGIEWTKTSRNADLVVDFTPSGTLLSGDETEDPFMLERATRLSRRFTTTFLQTTAAKPFLSSQFEILHDDPYAYDWEHPFRTLAWLDFMKEVGTMERPKFVFAHLIKPHFPYSFDRFGNITFDPSGWGHDHDPTVSGPFYGQLSWLNGQMLEVVDAILDDYEEPPIIVIAGDHGHGQRARNDILAAFLLPDGGDSVLYPSITSVNHFRAILDHYFGLDLGLLEDRVYGLGS